MLDLWVLLGHTATDFEEEAVGQFHDVRLVDGGHLLAVIVARELESVPGDTLRVLHSHDLQALDDARHGLVLQHGVFAVCVLADQHDVQFLLVPGGDSRDRFAVEHIHVEVEFVAEGDVPGNNFGGLTLGLNVSLDGESVALDRVDGVLQVWKGVIRRGEGPNIRDMLGSPSFPTSLSLMLITSKLTGTPAYLKISRTYSISSGPIPLPGSIVTACRPPYCAFGMSIWKEGSS